VVPKDTSLDAFEVQTRAYRALGPEGRVQLLAELSDAVRAVAMAGIRSRHPHYTEQETRQALYRLMLGDELVRAVWPDRPLVEP
jgi:hypothetical protein